MKSVSVENKLFKISLMIWVLFVLGSLGMESAGNIASDHEFSQGSSRKV